MTLQIEEYRREIVKSAIRHPYTIIEARPASGKSTMVPQYLVEAFDKVIVTNPRVMPCITLATYVAERRGTPVGDEVGYRTGFQKCYSENTKIEYVTDAFHFIKVIMGENVEKRIALIIDEVHEWKVSTEALVAWCKFMEEKWHVRVILMSATIKTDEFGKYFGEEKTNILRIPGKVYDVKVEERKAKTFLDTIKEKIIKGKNTLVFLPSIKKIYEMMEKLSGMNVIVLPLHSKLSWEEQKRCYCNYNRPVCILATNIAQTSVTIPNINAVVDSGEAIVPFENNGIIEYVVSPISKADITQRMWRAGRTEDGEYTLCSDIPIQDRDEYPIPEIQRTLIDQVALKLAVNEIDISELEFFHQPSNTQIKEAKKKLRLSGAIDENGNITDIGHKISKLPISTEKARMVLEAEKYNVVEEVIAISAIIENGGLLEKVKDKTGKYYSRSYRDFTTENGSDLLAELDIWQYLNSLDYINFYELGINGRSFKKIKKHIGKMTNALDGIVEINSGGGREAILKVCLSVNTHNIHKYYTSGEFVGEDGVSRKIDNKSCVYNRGSIGYNTFLIGKPIRIKPKNRYGLNYDVNLLTFVSTVSHEFLLELVPERIEKKVEISYSASEDAILVEEMLSFRGVQIYYGRHLDYQHPKYEILKSEYLKSHPVVNNQGKNPQKSQRVIKIDNQEYPVFYDYSQIPRVYLPDEVILRTKQNEVFLRNGERVYLCSHCMKDRKEETMEALRNALKSKLKDKAIADVKHRYANTKLDTIETLLQKREELGKVILQEEGISLGSVYVCAYLSKKRVTIEVVKDEEQQKATL